MIKKINKSTQEEVKGSGSSPPVSASSSYKELVEYSEKMIILTIMEDN